MRFPERVAAKLVWAALCLALASLLFPRVALADRAACAQAHEEGQREANAGHMRAASRLFVKCSNESSCPALIRQDCAEFFETVKRSIPSVVFGAQDETGTDVFAVKVYAGDELVADGLDGRAVELDPGQYHLRFLFPGGEVVASDVVLRESEKGRIIQVRKHARDGAGTASADEATKADAASSTGTSPTKRSPALRIAPWIAVGVGVAALGTGTVMAVVGNGKKSQLDACRPDCPSTKQPVYDNTKALYLGADIAFGTAAVATVVATWLFIASGGTDKPSPHQAPTSSVHPTAAFTPGGGVVGAFGTF
jgi:hypothetical protein